MFGWFFTQNLLLQQIGLLIMRVAVGLLFVRHGASKVVAGVSTWQWLGQQMSVFGITFFPIFWGLCATAAEFIGGTALALGFGTRIAAFFLVFNMIVAVLMHINKGDKFDVVEFPLLLLVFTIAFMIAGGGRFAIDAWLSAK